MIAKILRNSFEKWYVPIIIWAISILCFVFLGSSKNEIISKAILPFVGIGLLGLIIAFFYQIATGKGLAALLSGFLFVGTIAFVAIFSVFMTLTEMVDGDHWADNLTIPDNIPIENPTDINSDPMLRYNHKEIDSILATGKTSYEFQLYNSFQPGLYEYDFWTRRIDQGIIYLKAYEVTQNYRLSKSRLFETTKVSVDNPTDSIMKFGTTDHFTIYEGDWGKPYAARFEVWYKPQNGGEETKLMEKNYKIEGWMH